MKHTFTAAIIILVSLGIMAFLHAVIQPMHREMTTITGKSYTITESGQEWYFQVSIKGEPGECRTTRKKWVDLRNGSSILVEYQMTPVGVFGAVCE